MISTPNEAPAEALQTPEVRVAQPIQSEPVQPATQTTNDTGVQNSALLQALQAVTGLVEKLSNDKTEARQDDWQAPYGQKPQMTQQQWSMNNEAIRPEEGHPLMSVAADALGIDRREMTTSIDALQSVIENVVNLIHSDNPSDVYKFIAFHLRRSPAGPGKLRNFARYIEIMKKESEVK